MALIRVLGTHGYAAATIEAVASEAGVSPGLVHHHFADKQDLYGASIDVMIREFRSRVRSGAERSGLEAYAHAALALDSRSDVVAARAWVGLFAEALSDASLFQKLRRVLDGELEAIQRCADGKISVANASTVLSFVTGALVFGAFAPRRVAGFAEPSLQKIIETFGEEAARPNRKLAKDTS